MQRKRGELVPIGEVIADLPGPVKAIREASPQALHQSVVLVTGLLVSLRQRPVTGRPVADPFHPRAEEKCSTCERKGNSQVRSPVEVPGKCCFEE